MKNITISLDLDLARWLRIRSAEADTSVSRYVAGLLARVRQEEDGYRTAMEQALAVTPRQLRKRGQRLPARGELYDR